MGIQKDAGELLLYIYEKKTKGEEIPQIPDLTEATSWDKDRLLNALQYLCGKSLVDGKVIKGLGSTKPQFVAVNDIPPLGVDVMEDETKFSKNFNFTINLGVFSYSWGATKK